MAETGTDLSTAEEAARMLLRQQWPESEHEPNLGIVFKHLYEDEERGLLSSGESAVFNLALGLFNGQGEMAFGQAWRALDRETRKAFVRALVVWEHET